MQAGAAVNTNGATLAITLLNPTVNIPFPNAQNLSAGITVNNPTADTFTINTAGRYHITYSLYPTLTLLTSFQLFRNATAVPGTQVNAAIGIGMVFNQIIINITAGDTIRVTANASLVATVTLGAGTAAATVSIIQVS
ncbi:hypothetical protein KCTCHS21_13250 [Cohnella abietis]|uniref:BclA C-terminal domain-containing protein n=1 Tax=Cohnella abietis TaxID=2507935 RepID=A0A3T1D1F5_9BACL|nr:hypothetical protein KCTCHS21_13250 [Cohnella abietis]